MTCCLKLFPQGNNFKQQGIESTLETYLDSIHNSISLAAITKSGLADSVFQLGTQLNLPCIQLESSIEQSFSLDEMGMSDSALVRLLWANAHFSPGCDTDIRWKLYCGLTNVYLTLGEYQKVDSLVQITKSEWKSVDSAPKWYFSIMTNGAISLAYAGNINESSKMLLEILAEARRVKDDKFIQKTLINLATIHDKLIKDDSAYYYLELASANTLAAHDMDAYMTLQANLAVLDMEKKRYELANNRLDSVDVLARKYGNLPISAEILVNKASIAANQNKFNTAYFFLIDYVNLHDSILNLERVKAVTEVQEKYETEKKVRQINELQVANLGVKLTRNRFMFAGGGVLLLAIGLWSRLRIVRKSRSAVQHERDVSNGLLLNILPATVAEELKIKGSAEAKLYPSSTILFTDFKGFTEISGTMSPTDLVEELNTCFKAFDEITTRNGLEKIKTIGDAYMAAGAIPDTNKANALDVIKAGCEMQLFITLRKTERETQGLNAFEMRAGVHTGPVVAGIVGVKKFQYDLWGDTVNIASRMETNSAPGRVNISETTYQIVKDEPSLHFTPRGLIEVKGKGELQMYFVDLA
jgi:class 3 adenylate cyclase